MLYDLQQFRQNKKLSITKEVWQNTDRINFLTIHFYQLSRNKTRPPLGQYLKAANLLSDRQIVEILEEQKQVDLRFGEIAINKGWLNYETINFFLELMVV